jgi:plasmid stabilization system protein ParE
VPVVWRAKALVDVSCIVGYIAIANPVAARKVGRELLLGGDSLELFPNRGRPGRLAGTRELAVMPPYLIIYRVSARDGVTILRVWHVARDRPAPS